MRLFRNVNLAMLYLLLCFCTLYALFGMTPETSLSSEVRCVNKGRNCQIRHACVNTKFGIELFGDTNLFSKLKRKLENITYHDASGRSSFSRFSGDEQIAFAGEYATVGERYTDDNCGHVLGDEVWPVFGLNLIFRSAHSVVSDGMQNIYIRRVRNMACDSYFTQLWTNFEPVPLTSTRCFRYVFVGFTGLRYVDSDQYYSESIANPKPINFEERMRMFVQMFHRSIPVSKSSKKRIIVMEKRRGAHNAKIGNIEEVVQTLQNTYSDHVISKVCWEDYSTYQQIRLVSETRLFISLPGSDVMNTIFMQPGTRIVLFCRRVEGIEQGSHEKRLWLNRLTYLDKNIYCKQEQMSYNEFNDTLIRLDFISTLGKLD